MQPLADPELYSADAEGRVLLKGMRCICERVAFPYQRFGCERCGRVEGLQRVDLVATGTVAASVCVHMHFGTSPQAPFAVGAVKLDAGPMIRTLLDRDLQPGERVIGELAPLAGEGQQRLALRFALATS